MILDSQTNFVYFSELLVTKFPEIYAQIVAALDKHGVEHGILPGTKDIWARDNMPIQVANDRFIAYDYNPDYLQTDYYQKMRTEPLGVCESIGIKPEYMPLVIDGGNVIKCADCAIMTSKIFSENWVQPEDLLAKFREMFGVKVLFVPWDKEEELGHIDAICRPLPDGKLLFCPHSFIRPVAAEYAACSLEQYYYNLEYLEFRHPKHEDYLWAYMNFLQTEKVILLPRFGISEDEEALEQIQSFFPNYAGHIERIDMMPIVKKGGALNCISWNILA